MQTFDLKQFKNQPALIDGESKTTLTYENLDNAIHNFIRPLGSKKSLVFLFIHSTLDCLTAYLALLNYGHAVALFDGSLHPTLKQHLVSCYHPKFILEGISTNETQNFDYYEPIKTSFSSLSAWRLRNNEALHSIHPDLQLLLSTSGTTGSPKLIRLSRRNILSNASAICAYLTITAEERAIATLPFHYSYGLSVLHSHLIVGASLVLTPHSVIQEGFWQTFNRFRCTSLAGVPYTYQLIDRLGLENLDCPSLHTLTHAGGPLSPDLITKFHTLMQKRNGRFFTMYGQTEATARIAYVPPSYLPAKAGAIGIAIPGGKLQLFDNDQEIIQSKCEGELVYTGENVMLGYANHPQDLELGDMLKGVLPTGDLGYRDEDGIYFLTGRLKRISKVYGQRINLEEIESAASAFVRVAAMSNDTTIRLYYETTTGFDMDICIDFLSKTYHLAPSTFECIALEHFPLTSSGKIDYTKLKR